MALIHEKLVAVMKLAGPIGKNLKVSTKQGSYVARGIEDTYAALKPLFAENDIFCIPKIIDYKQEPIVSTNGAKGFHTTVRINFTFVTTDGSSIDTELVGEAIDYGDKSINKCISIAHKYALVTMFLIPVKDILDADKEVHEISNSNPDKESKIDLIKIIRSIFPEADIHLQKYIGDYFTETAKKQNISFSQYKNRMNFIELQGLVQELGDQYYKEAVSEG